jgi:protein SCO1/2
MKLLAVLALALLFAAAPDSVPLWAAFSAADLEAIAAAPPPGATLPLALRFVDETGRPMSLATALAGMPAAVIFADYTCHTLCGPILDFAASGLAKSGLHPGSDYRLLIIGLDPKDTIGAAQAMRATHFDAADEVARAAVFLTGTGADIQAATAALGYRYAYDAEHDQFAHPAAVYVIDASGRVVRMLSALGLSGADLRLAFVEAGHGAVGTFADRIHLLCYGYDPARGIYTERITLVLELAAGATVVLMTSGILAMLAIERRRAPS